MELMPKPEWMERGVCVGLDPDLFFTPSEELAVGRRSADWKPREKDGFADAVDICMSCPVRLFCLEYALENGDRDGVWGGATPNERLEMRRRIRAGDTIDEIVADEAARELEAA